MSRLNTALTRGSETLYERRYGVVCICPTASFRLFFGQESALIDDYVTSL
ncbi:MAG: hypothetical protein L7S70_11040 [Pseudomonadales bacterium]|nr:hypothetical protein [Pseudomonadales bacterium]